MDKTTLADEIAHNNNQTRCAIRDKHRSAAILWMAVAQQEHQWLEGQQEVGAMSDSEELLEVAGTGELTELLAHWRNATGTTAIVAALELASYHVRSEAKLRK